MKILLLHNFYRSSSPSGENVAFMSEKKLLIDNGHHVTSFIRDSDDITRKSMSSFILSVLSIPWNFFIARILKRKIVKFSPDVVHAHNTFPLLSPSVFSVSKNYSATVLTLHNYRLLCPAAIPMRDGKTCTECIIKKSIWPSLRFRCYRGSLIATLPLAIKVALHRFLGTWIKNIDAFIVFSSFQRNLMIKGGFPSEKIFIKPNFYLDYPSLTPFSNRLDQIVYVGRIGPEKGIQNLIEAWRIWGLDAPQLLIIGDGPLFSELSNNVVDLPIKFLGQLDHRNVKNMISNSKLLILPSECIEGFPMVILEAFALGTGVAVSNVGPLPLIIEEGKTGVVFEPANAESLLNVVQDLWSSAALLESIGKKARKTFEKKYTSEANHKQLMLIYRHAIENAKARGIKFRD